MAGPVNSSGIGLADLLKEVYIQFSYKGKVSDLSYLFYGLVSSDITPVVLPESVQISGASLRVGTPDPSRSFLLEILLNGNVVEALLLPSNNLKSYSTSFTQDTLPGDELSVRLRKLTGTGASSFQNISVLLALTKHN